MKDKEQQELLHKIKNIEELINLINPDNPNVPRWKEEIELLKLRVLFLDKEWNKNEQE